MAFFDQFVFYKSEIIRQTPVAVRATFTITKTFRVTKRSTKWSLIHEKSVQGKTKNGPPFWWCQVRVYDGGKF